MKNIEDKTKRELSELFKLDSKYVNRLIKTNKLITTRKKGRSNLYELKDFKKIIETIKQIPYIEIINDILDLIKKYNEHHIAVPQGLKGDIGELLVMNKLIQKFPDNTSILLGGTFPSIDVLSENKKIQVKTFLNRDDYKKSDFKVEYCPTIRKGFKERCDIVILVELYQTEEYRIDLSKTNYYIFGKSDFKHFNDIHTHRCRLFRPQTDGCLGIKFFHDFKSVIIDRLIGDDSPDRVNKIEPVIFALSTLDQQDVFFYNFNISDAG